MSSIVTTALSSVDGAAGVLRYRGVSLEDLVAAGVDYGHAVGLLATGELVDRGAPLNAVAVPAVDVGCAVFPSLRRAIAGVVASDEDAVAFAGACGRSVSRLRGRFVDGGSYASRILRGIADGDVSDSDVEDLDRCFVVHLDHALNPSTLACRVVAATGAPLAASLTAATCALEGPLHGGASTDVGRVLEDDVKDVADVARWWAALRAAKPSDASSASPKKKAPGFGHPIYRTRDPRSAVLRALCERAADRRRQRRFIDTAIAVDEVVVRESGGRLFANVDFYAAALYATLGVPRAFHTALFFAARVVGQACHAVEQQQRGRVISPEADYDGVAPRSLPR